MHSFYYLWQLCGIESKIFPFVFIITQRALLAQHQDCHQLLLFHFLPVFLLFLFFLLLNDKYLCHFLPPSPPTGLFVSWIERLQQPTRVLLRGRIFFKDSGCLSWREECEQQIVQDNRSLVWTTENAVDYYQEQRGTERNIFFVISRAAEFVILQVSLMKSIQEHLDAVTLHLHVSAWSKDPDKCFCLLLRSCFFFHAHYVSTRIFWVFRNGAVIQIIMASDRTDIDTLLQCCHQWARDGVGSQFSMCHRPEQKKAFKLRWVNTAEVKMKEERDETCFMLGACIVQLWWHLTELLMWPFAVRGAADSYCSPLCSLTLSTFLFCSILPQSWISCPSWWCHILWYLLAWRRPPFPWRWARWTDWARWPALPTWHSFTPTPPPGLPPPSLRWTQMPGSRVDLTGSQSPPEL